MTRIELEELISRPTDALTTRDIAALRHARVMLEIMPDYLETLKAPELSVYSDITTVDSRFVRRVRVG